MALAAALVVAGCGLVQLRRESAAFESSTVLAGRIACPEGLPSSPLVVASIAEKDRRVEHQARLHECGGYELLASAGPHTVLAFADLDGDGRPGAGEPWVQQGPFEVGGTGVVSGVDLVLPPVPPAGAPPAWAAPDRPVPVLHSTQAGAVLSLEDAAFDPAQGALGYWAPMTAFRLHGGNVYALEPYDPQRVPVLFVHGAAGTPRDLAPLIARLDRRRYQAWVYAYPSGASIESTAYLLYWKLLNLQLRYRFSRWAVVAHSMGGLVTRTALSTLGPEVPAPRLFVSISTPWGGEPAAETGVRHSPAVVPSWHDLRPEGPFMAGLFQRPLPAGTEHVLLFGHRGGYSLMRPNTDGTVTLASQLRPEAQAGAVRVMGFDDDHMSILASPQVAQVVHAWLDSTLSADRAGQGQLRLTLDAPAGLAIGLPNLRLKPLEGGGEALTLLLTEADRDRALGPLPPGRYEAAVLALGFATEPRRQNITVQEGQVTALRVALSPVGALSGFVGAPPAAPQVGAGVRVQPDHRVRVRRVALSGPGVRRELRPRQGQGLDEALERLIDGQDDASGPHFTFQQLPAGDYELVIEAEGYRPHRSRHTVVPGRMEPMAPVLLQALQ